MGNDEMKTDIWRTITDSKWHPAPSSVTKEKLMENSPFEQMFNEGDWSVVSIPDTKCPWIVHYCEDQIYRGLTWNYVLSSNTALENYERGSHYACVECGKKAPDHTITVLKMLA
jgi:hypothetical protein